jgi:type IV secretory pathway VirJ component
VQTTTVTSPCSMCTQFMGVCSCADLTRLNTQIASMQHHCQVLEKALHQRQMQCQAQLLTYSYTMTALSGATSAPATGSITTSTVSASTTYPSTTATVATQIATAPITHLAITPIVVPPATQSSTTSGTQTVVGIQYSTANTYTTPSSTTMVNNVAVYGSGPYPYQTTAVDKVMTPEQITSVGTATNSRTNTVQQGTSLIKTNTTDYITHMQGVYTTEDVTTVTTHYADRDEIVITKKLPL